jgi:NAD(P)H-hydrate epimerase
VRVIEPVGAKTPDAVAERALALDVLDADGVVTDALPTGFDQGEPIVIDGLLGTGAQGKPRGLVADAIERMARMRARGVALVALDLVSGLDATNGDGESLGADLTLTFGTVKRGHLMRREACGTIVVLDIGLGLHAELDDDAPRLVDDWWMAGHVPSIPPSAHKGVRKKLAIVGGAEGMAGAAVLAARAAQRSGIGMVKLVVAAESIPIVQQTDPYALAAAWPADDAAVDEHIVNWADAVVIGPGLGRSDASRSVLDRVLRRWSGPTLLDADALTLFEGRLTALGTLLGRRPVLVTPHPVEFGRLADLPVSDVLDQRFDVGRAAAAALGGVVLLKGTPTVVTNAHGERLVSASGNSALATAGSGDVLSGIAGTLLAQLGDPFVAGAAAAWVHGRAAERVPSNANGAQRGVSLDDVIGELRDAWSFDDRPARYPVLMELPNLGGAP